MRPRPPPMPARTPRKDKKFQQAARRKLRRQYKRAKIDDAAEQTRITKTKLSTTRSGTTSRATRRTPSELGQKRWADKIKHERQANGAHIRQAEEARQTGARSVNSRATTRHGKPRQPIVSIRITPQKNAAQRCAHSKGRTSGTRAPADVQKPNPPEATNRKHHTAQIDT